MWNWLAKLFGKQDGPASPPVEYDPVYGLPRRAVEEWLARNPQLREEYKVREWLARNPPLNEDYEAALRRRIAALRGGRILVLCVDVKPHQGGVVVPFFGHPAAAVTGPALLAMKSGAPVYSAATYRLGLPAGGRIVPARLRDAFRRG